MTTAAPVVRRRSPKTSTTTSSIEFDFNQQPPTVNSHRSSTAFFTIGLRSPGSSILRRSTVPPKKKAPLAVSLSWDDAEQQQHRSRSSSTNSQRSRIHSDSSTTKDRRKAAAADESDRLELENTCLHCSLSAEFKKNALKNEIENAVQRLARRLGGGANTKPSSWPRVTDMDTTTSAAVLTKRGTPDIVVSSISSDEETDLVGRNTSSGSIPTSGASSPTSSTSASPMHQPQLIDTYFGGAAEHMSLDASKECLQSITTPVVIVMTKKGRNSIRMDSLMPPKPIAVCAPNPAQVNDQSNSPPRSNSVDLSTLRRDIEMLSISSGDSEIGSDSEFEPGSPNNNDVAFKTLRSRSHDPTPSPDHLLRRPSRIEHLSELFRKALAKSPVVTKRTTTSASLYENENTDQQQQQSRNVNRHRTSRYWLDDRIHAAEHIWLPSSGPGSSTATNMSTADSECYVGEKDCAKMGEKCRCAVCHIVAHSGCIPLLSKMNLNCKTTFRDASARKQPTKETYDVLSRHHWVHRWKHEGRCQHCQKSFQQRMFREKEVIAITCAWCKQSYHNKKNCFTMTRMDEVCSRGILRELIVPPSWILRLPNVTRKRSAVVAASSAPSTIKRKRTRSSQRARAFIVKPSGGPPTNDRPSLPLLVFVNPKSGGNKGSKALHALCWLLNPRQVFDITALKGPRYGLEMFRKVVTQLRLLVCGGDGTVGWVLATLDQLNWATYPPMALLPLGTGNDLSRCMGWGGVYSDEPLGELLTSIITETSVTHLDRWRLDVQPNMHAMMRRESTSIDSNIEMHPQQHESPAATIQSSLPLTVMNNYFSIGADAHVALQFHHSRSANPQMLNSRFKNRIAYGGLGTIDLFKRSWRDLSDFMTLECDGQELTAKIREFKFHCILFHNITYYACGTVPWGSDHTSDNMTRPSCCDGLIEVLGFTTATLAALQMGGKGERIAQCSYARIVTRKPIPMQVDGEPCLLAPSIITMRFHSKVPMLRRDKRTAANYGTAGVNSGASTSIGLRRLHHKTSADNTSIKSAVIVRVPVLVVGRYDYDMYRDAIDRLKDTAFEIGTISVEAETSLDQARAHIQRVLAEHPCLPYEPDRDWRFLDYVSSSEEGTFRVTRHKEPSQSISDIGNLDECIILLDDAFPSMTSRASAIGADLTFAPAALSAHSRQQSMTPPYQQLKPIISPPVLPTPLSTGSVIRSQARRISETLRIVLSSDAKETHL